MSDPERDPKRLADAATLVAFPTEPTPPPARQAHAPPDLPSGTVLADRYEIEALLGRGGMGTVYVANDRLLGDKVALKLLDLGSRHAQVALDAVRAEVRLARKVKHANVVRIHDLVENDNAVFLTMELCAGTDLRRVLVQEGGWLSAERAARVTLALAEALAAAHAVGVVHRDIKPENVMLDPSGRVLLTDFGIAVAHDPGESGVQSPGAIMGTPAYMSPEQVDGGVLRPASDIFAVGIVLFEMLAGELPFSGDGPIGVAVARLQAAPKALPVDRPIPDDIAALTRACLARDPSARPTAADIARTLARFLEGRTSFDATPASVYPTSESPRDFVFPYSPGPRALACLPFAYEGPADHEFLSAALSSELIDVLSRAKNLRVLGSGATRRLETYDPREACAKLGVDYVVEGRVELVDDELRIRVRLLAATGEELFSEHFELGWVDVLEVQERAGRRIAEALRTELLTREARVGVPEEAILLYLQARKAQRASMFSETAHSIDRLERALMLAPNFAPAVAAYAYSAVEMWFLPQGATTVKNWSSIAQQSVAHALQHAPDLAETHVAAARFASHSGDLLTAVHALRRALEIAPTSPEAHTIMGQLECETGRIQAGLSRLRMAQELEPSNGTYSYEAGRIASFAGDHAGFRRRYAELSVKNPGLVQAHMALRHALWWRDEALLDEAVGLSVTTSIAALFKAVARTVRGETTPQSTIELLAVVMGYVNPRFAALLRQVAVEVYLRVGELPEAVFALQEAHRNLLYDVAWLERCPLLTPIRGTRAFQSILAEVKFRADEVWAK